MKAHVFFWPVLLYIGVYLVLAKQILGEVRRIEGAYESKRDWPRFLNWNDSIATARLMRDAEMPRPEYPRNLKIKFGVARFVLNTAPLAMMAVLLLVVLFAK